LGEWREGIALLARAIKFDLENKVASERFFQELTSIVKRRCHRSSPPLPIRMVSGARHLVQTVPGF
jgi:hypothetical protein